MTPLPPHVPQCKALYDFRMSNDEEDGCLTFNKVNEDYIKCNLLQIIQNVNSFSGRNY